MKRFLLLFGLLLFAASAAAQTVGIEVGKVLAVDRVAKLMLLTDRSVWSLAEAREDRVADIGAGDRVNFSYRTAEEGPAVILEIEITHHVSETKSIEIADDTVLAYDRREMLLILADKSIWPLRGLDPAPPPGLGAGDRVRIEHRNDEEGRVIIEDLIVIFQ